jgi:arsenite-transporting ATPase
MVMKRLMDGGGRDTRFVFFSGKGGVGKTSVAAATALWLAREGKKVLVISTDPAHSLADSLDTKIGGEVRGIGRNLYAVEIDPKLSMKEYREMLSPELEKAPALRGLGLDEAFDMAGMTPGIDELASFDTFLRHMNSREYDVIVFDTAPTGHTLRFLSLPDVLDSWLGKLIRIRMRLSGITGMVRKLLSREDEDEGDNTLERLEEMKRRIEHARELLSDPDKTEYNIVMIPEAMCIYESERSVSFLKECSIPIGKVIVNQIIPDNTQCGFCSSKRKTQLERLSEIKSKFHPNKVMELRLFEEEVRGRESLERVARELYGGACT